MKKRETVLPVESKGTNNFAAKFFGGRLELLACTMHPGVYDSDCSTCMRELSKASDLITGYPIINKS